METKKSIPMLVFQELEYQTSSLTDEQMGALFRAMLKFNRDIEPDISDPLVSLAFSFVRSSMTANKEKYIETCNKRQEAGRKGGRPRKNQTPAEDADFLAEKANGFSEKPENHSKSKSSSKSNSNPKTSLSLGLSPRQSMDEQTVDGDRDREQENQDYVDVLKYAQNAGYSLTNKQKRQLKRWCSLFSFEVVIMAFDRSTFYNGKSVSYVYRILQEWESKGLTDIDAVSAYVAEREGGESA